MISSHQYLTNVQSWDRLFGCETIHPTQKFTLMNLLQMPCVITLAWSFLTSEIVEAVRGQKHHISAHTLALLTQRSVHPTVPLLLTKDSPRNEINYDSQLPFSLHISNSRTKPDWLFHKMRQKISSQSTSLRFTTLHQAKLRGKKEYTARKKGG